MFSKAKPTATAENQSEAPVKTVPSILSADLSIVGNVKSSGEIQVDGRVEGDIHCKALIVGIDGAIVGEVVAQNVRLHGEITGRVRAKSVFLASTAKMTGDVAHESLAIEPGAFLEGHCRRVTDSDRLSEEAAAKTAGANTGSGNGTTTQTAPASSIKPGAAPSSPTAAPAGGVPKAAAAVS